MYVDDKQKNHNLLMDSVVGDARTDFALAQQAWSRRELCTGDDGVTVLTKPATGQTAIVGSACQGGKYKPDKQGGYQPSDRQLLRGPRGDCEDAAAGGQERAQQQGRGLEAANALMAASVRGHKRWLA